MYVIFQMVSTIPANLDKRNCVVKEFMILSRRLLLVYFSIFTEIIFNAFQQLIKLVIFLHIILYYKHILNTNIDTV